MRAVWDEGLASVSDDSDEVYCSKLSLGGRLYMAGERGCGQMGRESGLLGVGDRLRPWLLRGPVAALGLNSPSQVGYGADAAVIVGWASHSSSPRTEGGVPPPKGW